MCDLQCQQCFFDDITFSPAINVHYKVDKYLRPPTTADTPSRPRLVQPRFSSCTQLTVYIYKIKLSRSCPIPSRFPPRTVPLPHLYAGAGVQEKCDEGRGQALAASQVQDLCSTVHYSTLLYSVMRGGVRPWLPTRCRTCTL